MFIATQISLVILGIISLTYHHNNPPQIAEDQIAARELQGHGNQSDPILSDNNKNDEKPTAKIDTDQPSSAPDKDSEIASSPQDQGNEEEEERHLVNLETTTDVIDLFLHSARKNGRISANTRASIIDKTKQYSINELRGLFFRLIEVANNNKPKTRKFHAINFHHVCSALSYNDTEVPREQPNETERHTLFNQFLKHMKTAPSIKKKKPALLSKFVQYTDGKSYPEIYATCFAILHNARESNKKGCIAPTHCLAVLR